MAISIATRHRRILQAMFVAGRTAIVVLYFVILACTPERRATTVPGTTTTPPPGVAQCDPLGGSAMDFVTDHSCEICAQAIDPDRYKLGRHAYHEADFIVRTANIAGAESKHAGSDENKAEKSYEDSVRARIHGLAYLSYYQSQSLHGLHGSRFGLVALQEVYENVEDAFTGQGETIATIPTTIAVLLPTMTTWSRSRCGYPTDPRSVETCLRQ